METVLDGSLCSDQSSGWVMNSDVKPVQRFCGGGDFVKGATVGRSFSAFTAGMLLTVGAARAALPLFRIDDTTVSRGLKRVDAAIGSVPRGRRGAAAGAARPNAFGTASKGSA